MIRLLFMVTYLTLLMGCQLQAQQPAVLKTFSEDSSAQIRLIVEDALDTKSVLISQSAFTQSSLLIIQRQPTQAFNDLPLFTETELPNLFMLLKDSNGCLIRHKQSQKQWYLREIDCKNAEEL